MDSRATPAIQDFQLTKTDYVINFLRNSFVVGSQEGQWWINVFLALTAFSLTVSLSLKAIFLILSSLTIVYHKRSELLRVVMSPWGLSALALFLVIVLGCLFTPANRHLQFDFIHKYSKLLYLPILALGFQDKQSRSWAIHAFLFGCLITIGYSAYRVFTMGITEAPGTAFYNYIVTGYFVAFAAFLAGIYALRSQGYVRVGYFFLIGLFSSHMFLVNIGKTGYVMFLVLSLIFSLVYMQWRYFFKGVFVVFLGLLIVSQSPLFKAGVGRVVNELHDYRQGQKDGSLGTRLQFHNFAQSLFSRSPLIGVGTGGFAHYFSLENPVPSWTGNLIEPHGELWSIGAEHGVLGLSVFLFFMLTLFYEVYRVKDMQVIFLGLLVTFCLGCFSDGFLLLAGPGFLLIIFAAMGLGESLSLESAALQDDLKNRRINT